MRPLALALVLSFAAMTTHADNAVPGRAQLTDVKSLLALRTLSRKEVVARLAPAEIADDVGYERIKPATRISNQKLHPAYFFFRGERLVMVYIGRAAALPLTAAAVEKELGGPGVYVRSRAGKRSNQHVYAERGFAFSEEDGRIEFVEIFPPMTHKQYLDTIYEDPGEFIK